MMIMIMIIVRMTSPLLWIMIIHFICIQGSCRYNIGEGRQSIELLLFESEALAPIPSELGIVELELEGF